MFAGRTLNNLAAESWKVPPSIRISDLVAAPDRKDRRCLTYLVVRKTVSWESAKPGERVRERGNLFSVLLVTTLS